MSYAELRYENNYLKIKNFVHHQKDIYYNTLFDLEVCSGDFCGTAPCEYCFAEFKKFIDSLDSIYQFKKTTAKLDEIGYGSKVIFQADKIGHIEVSGEIFGNGMIHSLKFSFNADQTVLGDFIKQLRKLVDIYRD